MLLRYVMGRGIWWALVRPLRWRSVLVLCPEFETINATNKQYDRQLHNIIGWNWLLGSNFQNALFSQVHFDLLYSVMQVSVEYRRANVVIKAASSTDEMFCNSCLFHARQLVDVPRKYLQAIATPVCRNKMVSVRRSRDDSVVELRGIKELFGGKWEVWLNSWIEPNSLLHFSLCSNFHELSHIKNWLPLVNFLVIWSKWVQKGNVCILWFSRKQRTIDVVVNSWIFSSEARKNHELTNVMKDSDWSIAC